MKNILILEDKEKTLTALEQAVREISGHICVHKATTYEHACKIAFLHQIDVFILDIILTTKVPGDISGILFAEQVRKHENYLFTPIIFITALSDPKLHAYRRIHSFGYLEKPFSMHEAVELVEAALKYSPPVNQNQVVYMRKDGILIAVKINDIQYVTTNNHILDIHLQNEILKIPYMTIKQFLKSAGKGRFIQCSRNTVVNKYGIHSIDMTNKYIRLSNGIQLEIGISFCKKISQEILSE